MFFFFANISCKKILLIIDIGLILEDCIFYFIFLFFAYP